MSVYHSVADLPHELDVAFSFVSREIRLCVGLRETIFLELSEAQELTSALSQAIVEVMNRD